MHETPLKNLVQTGHTVYKRSKTGIGPMKLRSPKRLVFVFVPRPPPQLRLTTLKTRPEGQDSHCPVWQLQKLGRVQAVQSVPLLQGSSMVHFLMVEKAGGEKGLPMQFSRSPGKERKKALEMHCLVLGSKPVSRGQDWQELEGKLKQKGRLQLMQCCPLKKGSSLGQNKASISLAASPTWFSTEVSLLNLPPSIEHPAEHDLHSFSATSQTWPSWLHLKQRLFFPRKGKLTGQGTAPQTDCSSADLSWYCLAVMLPQVHAALVFKLGMFLVCSVTRKGTVSSPEVLPSQCQTISFLRPSIVRWMNQFWYCIRWLRQQQGSLSRVLRVQQDWNQIQFIDFRIEEQAVLFTTAGHDQVFRDIGRNRSDHSCSDSSDSSSSPPTRRRVSVQGVVPNCKFTFRLLLTLPISVSNCSMLRTRCRSCSRQSCCSVGEEPVLPRSRKRSMRGAII